MSLPIRPEAVRMRDQVTCRSHLFYRPCTYSTRRSLSLIILSATPMESERSCAQITPWQYEIWEKLFQIPLSSPDGIGAEFILKDWGSKRIFKQMVDVLLAMYLAWMHLLNYAGRSNWIKLQIWKYCIGSFRDGLRSLKQHIKYFHFFRCKIQLNLPVFSTLYDPSRVNA